MSDSRVVTVEELQAHTKKEDLWVLLSGKVYDVTKFIDEHPGGDEVILAEAGKDATEAFEDIGHSDEARALLPEMLVGSLEVGGLEKANAHSRAKKGGFDAGKAVQQGSNAFYAFPLVGLVAYFAYRYYTGSA